MKNFTLLIILLIFSFTSGKLLAQSTPILVEKIHEIYDDNRGDFWKPLHEYFEYTNDGKIQKVERVIYFDEAVIENWLGQFYEYDSQGRLSKRINKNFNQDVKIWITQDWEEFFYDDNGCIIKSVYIQNTGGVQDSSFYINDDQCRPLRIDYFNNTSNYFTYEYPDDYGSEISSLYWKPDSVWIEFIIKENILNEYGDLIKEATYAKNNGVDTSNFMEAVYDYDYTFDPITNNIIDKTKTGWRFSSNLIDTSVLSSQYFTYDYNCQGLLIQEDRNPNQHNMFSWRRMTSIYSGKNDCFDYDQEFNISISPNPTNGQVSIASNIFESGDTQLRVFSFDGKMMLERLLSTSKESQEVDLSFLRNGIYIIHLISEDHFASTKLIIQK